jgi:hypothetical protein
MYAVTDKEKQGTGGIRGLNFAAVRPTTLLLANFSFREVA